MEHMSNIFSTNFGINFAKLIRVWLALISLALKSTAYFFWATLYKPKSAFFYRSSTTEHMLVAVQELGFSSLLNITMSELGDSYSVLDFFNVSMWY